MNKILSFIIILSFTGCGNSTNNEQSNKEVIEDIIIKEQSTANDIVIADIITQDEKKDEKTINDVLIKPEIKDNEIIVEKIIEDKIIEDKVIEDKVIEDKKTTTKEDVEIILINNKEELGELLFFDKNLSQNKTQSCATCHNPENAFVDKRNNTLMKELKYAVSIGDDNKSIGNRNTPTLNYVKFTPSFHSTYPIAGGMFYDGRANNLDIQAGMPILN